MSPVLFVAHSDEWMSARVRRWTPPPWFEAGMIAFTRLGDGWVWIAVLLTGAGADHGPGRAIAETAAAIVVVNAAQVALKRAFRRSRPAVPLASSSRRVVAAPDPFSFPSGHTMNAFAVAVLVTVHLPPAAPWAFAVASGVGASRVVLQLHYPSDVAAGAACGSVLAAILAAVLGG